MPAVIAGCMPGGFGSLVFVIAIPFGFMLVLSCGVLIAAYVLRLACRIAAVPTPDIDQALFVSCVEAMIASMIALGCLIAPDLVAEHLSIQLTWLATLVGLSTVAVTLIIPACVYVPGLRVTFLKAMVIAFVRYSFTFSLLAALCLLWALGSGTT
jgi:hypothetical protein